MIPLVTETKPPVHFTVDHTGCYRNTEPFYPSIGYAEGEGNITLRPISQKAQGLTLWDMELEAIDDFSLFEKHVEKIELFCKETLPSVKEKTFGVCLFKGNLDFFKEIQEEELEKFTDFAKAHPLCAMQLPLFRATLYGEYFHRLLSFFPEDLPIFLMLDVGHLSSSYIAKILVSSRFRYLHLLLTGSLIPAGLLTEKKEHPTLGVVLPKDEECSLEILTALEKLFERLQQEKTSYRILPEEWLSEQWNGIDQLFVLEKALSPKGKRLLLGFEAAGGTVVFF